MKAVSKEERNATKVTDEGEAGPHHCRGHCRGGRRYNNAAGGGSSGNTPTAKYPTHNKDLPVNLVIDNTGHNDAANFQCTLKGLAIFLHTTTAPRSPLLSSRCKPLLSPSKKNPRHGRTLQDKTFLSLPERSINGKRSTMRN